MQLYLFFSDHIGNKHVRLSKHVVYAVDADTPCGFNASSQDFESLRKGDNYVHYFCSSKLSYILWVVSLSKPYTTDAAFNSKYP